MGVDEDEDVGGCTVMRGIVVGLGESGTEHASSNRTVAAVAVALPPRGAGGAGLSPARSSAVHCSAPLERARVGRRNTRVSAVRAQRAVEAPVVLCARRSVRACNVMSTLCLTGAVAEIACSVNCGTSSLSSSSPPSPCLGFLLSTVLLGRDEGECLRLAAAGCWEEEEEANEVVVVVVVGWRACRARWTDVWISSQESRMLGVSSGRDGPPDARRSAVSMNFEWERCAFVLAVVLWDGPATISGGTMPFGMAVRRASRYSWVWWCG